MPQSRSQGRAPPAPRAGSPCGPCACGAGAASRPPPPAEAIRAGSALGAGGGWLVLGSWGLGGDEFSSVVVDVVEVGVVVVVVVVGVVRRHLLDAGGDAPHRLHIRLRGRPAPRPPPFVLPSPLGSHAPSCLCLGVHGALALALGSLAGPHAPVPLPVPWVSTPATHALACTAGAHALLVPVPLPLAAPVLAHRPPLSSMRPVAARLGALPAPLRALPVPWPLPGALPCVAPSAARALPLCAAAGLGAPSVFAPLLLAACALARPLRVPLGTSPVASCPPPRAPVAGTLPCLRAVPSFLLPLQLRQRDARRRTLGRRGVDMPRPPPGEWLGKERLGGAGVGVGGVGVDAVLRALPAHCCCCGGRRRGARGPRGARPPRLWRAGGRGVSGRGGGAARRGRGCNPSPTLPARLCGCGSPRRCARVLRRGSPPCRRRAGGRGRGRGVACQGLRSVAPRASGVPSRGGAAGLAAWAAVAVTSAGSDSLVDSPVSSEAARGRPAGGPTGTVPFASLRSSRSAGVSPAHSGETGERERDLRWWRSSRWGEP